MSDAKQKAELGFPAPSRADLEGGDEVKMLHQEVTKPKHPFGRLKPSVFALEIFQSLNDGPYTDEIVQALEKALPEIVVAARNALDGIDAPPEVQAILDKLRAESGDPKKGVYAPYMLYMGLALMCTAMSQIGCEQNVAARYAMIAEFTRFYALHGIAASGQKAKLSPDDASQLEGLQAVLEPPPFPLVNSILEGRKQIEAEAKAKGVTVEAYTAEMRQRILDKVTDGAKSKGKLPGEPDDEMAF